MTVNLGLCLLWCVAGWSNVNSQTAEEDFSCFPESQQKIITYVNNPNKQPELPKIRVGQGFYDSQWVFNCFL